MPSVTFRNYVNSFMVVSSTGLHRRGSNNRPWNRSHFPAIYSERYANHILWMAVWRIILTVWDSTRKKIWRGGVVLYRSR